MTGSAPGTPLLACHKAVAYMGDMGDIHRACAFEANNPHSLDREAFGQMADAAEGGIRTFSGVKGLGSEVVHNQGTMRRQAERIADLEAQIAELTAHHSSASA